VSDSLENRFDGDVASLRARNRALETALRELLDFVDDLVIRIVRARCGVPQAEAVSAEPVIRARALLSPDGRAER
jgi:hypothetical protein